jgi:C4-dicarboxylate-specific signal transduction histidine kinase
METPIAAKSSPRPIATMSTNASDDLTTAMTVARITQALSQEIVLENLVRTLLRMALEVCGAQRGTLITRQPDNTLRTEACARTGPLGLSVQMSGLPPAADELPLSLLDTVIRTREAIHGSFDEARVSHADDPYLQQAQSHALCCLPMCKQSEVVGVLYLEHESPAGAAAATQFALLQLLATQAAISLENARQYAQLVEENALRRQAEQTMRRSEEWLALGQRISHTGTFRFNHRSGELDWSDEHFRIFGWEPGSVTPSGKLAFSRVHPQDRGRFAQARADISQRDLQVDLEFRILIPGRGVRHVVARGWRTGDEEVGTLTDVTDVKAAESALRVAQSDLAHVTRVAVMGELATSIAHEVNQPLTAIVTKAGASLRWLARAEPDLDEVRTGLKDIVQEGQRLGQVIRGLRALVKKQDPVFALFELHEAIEQALMLIRTELDLHQVIVRLQDPSPGIQAYGDRIQIQQVMLNLMLNAAEAMGQVEGRARELGITVMATPGNTVQVSISDSGPGLTQESRDRVFESFYSTKTNGLGMGLPISRALIESHGGRIWAAPGSPHGAVFSFELPAHASV